MHAIESQLAAVLSPGGGRRQFASRTRRSGSNSWELGSPDIRKRRALPSSVAPPLDCSCSAWTRARSGSGLRARLSPIYVGLLGGLINGREARLGDGLRK